MLNNEEIKKVKDRASEMKATYPKWRSGQCFFNALYELFPEVGDLVNGSSVDPFYFDDRIDSCIEFLKK